MSFECKKCDKKFMYKHSLQKHENNKTCTGRIYTIDKNNNGNLCKFCNKQFNNKTSMYRHTKHICKIKKKDDLYYLQACEKILNLEKINADITSDCDKLREELISLQQNNSDITNVNNINDNVQTNIKIEEDKEKNIKYKENTEKNKKIKDGKPKLISKQSIPKAIKHLVWNKYIGEENGNGFCKCCKTTAISQMNFHCGHIKSEFYGGLSTLDNLIPLCGLCNSSMGKMNFNEFIKKHGLDKKEDYKKEEYNKEDYKKEDYKKEKCNNLEIIQNYLDKFTIQYLKQICMSLLTRSDDLSNQNMIYISPNGTKQKLIDKIIYNKYRSSEIYKLISDNKYKEYFIRCSGDLKKRCDDCKDNLDNVQCDNCNSIHTYYTNTKYSNNNDVMINNYKIINYLDRYVKCEVCISENIYIEEFKNIFVEI